MRNENLKKIIFAGLLIAIGIVLTNILSISYPPNSTIIRFGIGYLPLMLISILLGPKIGFSSALIQDILGYFIYILIYGYSSGPFYLGFTFSAILYGVLPGIIYNLRIKDFSLFRIINFGFLLLMFGLGVWGFFNIEWIIEIIRTKLSEDMTFEPWVIYAMLGVGELGIIGIIAFLFQLRNEDDRAHRIIFTVIILQILVTLILTPIWVMDLYGIPFWGQQPLRIIKTPIEIFIYSILLIRIVKAMKVYVARDLEVKE